MAVGESKVEGWKESDGGDEVGDGVVEIDFAVEIGLPVKGKEEMVLFPAALGEDVAESIRDLVRLGRRGWRRGSVACALLECRIIFRSSPLLCCGIVHHGAENFAGGVDD